MIFKTKEQATIVEAILTNQGYIADVEHIKKDLIPDEWVVVVAGIDTDEIKREDGMPY